MSAINVATAKPQEFQIPTDWVWVQLSDIAYIEMGNSPSSTSYNKEGNGVPLINGPTEFGPEPLDNPKVVQFTDSPTKFCEVGDLLVCVRGSTTGRTNVASFRACVGRGVAAIRAPECQAYVNHYIAAQAEHLASIGTGSVFSNVSSAQLSALKIPLPPRTEQERIVLAIEQSLSEISAGINSLKQAQEDLVRLRATVLRAAVTGELTKRFRHSVDTEDPKIQDEMLSEQERSKSIRRQRKDDAQGKLFPDDEQDAPDLNSHGPLPNGWIQVTFDQICEVQLGRAKNPENRSSQYPIPYLRAANITEAGLDLSNIFEMDFPPNEREKYQLHMGDLIISEASGSTSQVGKPAMWRDELPVCCFQNTVIRLRPTWVESEYILILLQHCYFNRIFAGLSSGVGINHLGGSRLAKIVVPVMPSTEREKIIVEVNLQLEGVQMSRMAINQSLVAANQLREAVLFRAFRGELVASQASNEPIEALLEKIRERREMEKVLRQSTPSNKKMSKIKTPKKRRALIDVLREHPDGISPDELLAKSNYTLMEIDEFYEKLSLISDEFLEDKPSGDEAFRWPSGVQVQLRLKAGK